MKEQIEKLVELLQTRKTVERLIEAEDKLKLFNYEKEEIKIELENFKKALQESNSLDGCGCTFEILPSNALEICVICLMNSIDETAMFPLRSEYEKLPNALWEVGGTKKRTARILSEFLEEDSFSGFEMEYLLNKFF